MRVHDDRVECRPPPPYFPSRHVLRSPPRRCRPKPTSAVGDGGRGSAMPNARGGADH
ncbi:hypothetical protein BN2537_16075 [Streptomyces venezuelae]|nr:hypothetical protein BN2537_16075 [Streptomyces venezuelae]